LQVKNSACADTISGPIVLVPHSMGGTVITNAAAGKSNVKALVYIAAFAPDVGETQGGAHQQVPRQPHRAGERGGPLCEARRHHRKLEHWMYSRAKARKVIEVPASSHVAMISHPTITADLIDEAAKTIS
jgi:hypothetical protein